MANQNESIAQPALKYLIAALVALACALALAGCSSGSSTSSSSADNAQATSESTMATDDEAENGEDAAESESAAAEEDSTASLQEAMDEARAKGLEAFEGTLYVLSGEDLLKLQDMDPNMPPDSGEFAVLVFDEEADVTGMSGDGSGPRTDTATMLGVAQYTEYESLVIDSGDLESWRAYDGQHIAVAVAADDIWFPSDVSEPIGEPRTGDAIIL